MVCECAAGSKDKSKGKLRRERIDEDQVSPADRNDSKLVAKQPEVWFLWESVRLLLSRRKFPRLEKAGASKRKTGKEKGRSTKNERKEF